MYFVLRHKNCYINIVLGEYDYDFNPGCKQWAWSMQFGKWQRGEGVRYSVEGNDARVEYWEEKDRKRTTWGVRAPWYKNEYPWR